MHFGVGASYVIAQSGYSGTLGHNCGIVNQIEHDVR